MTLLIHELIERAGLQLRKQQQRALVSIRPCQHSPCHLYHLQHCQLQSTGACMRMYRCDKVHLRVTSIEAAQDQNVFKKWDPRIGWQIPGCVTCTLHHYPLKMLQSCHGGMQSAALVPGMTTHSSTQRRRPSILPLRVSSLSTQGSRLVLAHLFHPR
jgi:hypothetical protein